MVPGVPDEVLNEIKLQFRNDPTHFEESFTAMSELAISETTEINRASERWEMIQTSQPGDPAITPDGLSASLNALNPGLWNRAGQLDGWKLRSRNITSSVSVEIRRSKTYPNSEFEDIGHQLNCSFTFLLNCFQN